MNMNMNERIRELMKQAMELVDPYAVEGEFGPRELNAEKFAQLIIRECADIAREVGTNTVPEDFALDKCYEIEDKIKQHFGVEL
jgi:hypothetical protein